MLVFELFHFLDKELEGLVAAVDLGFDIHWLLPSDGCFLLRLFGRNPVWCVFFMTRFDCIFRVSEVLFYFLPFVWIAISVGAVGSKLLGVASFGFLGWPSVTVIVA